MTAPAQDPYRGCAFRVIFQWAPQGPQYSPSGLTRRDAGKLNAALGYVCLCMYKCNVI